jgi:prolyl 4-hydroxylase
MKALAVPRYFWYFSAVGILGAFFLGNRLSADRNHAPEKYEDHTKHTNSTPSYPKSSTIAGCIDLQADCSYWKEEGYCESDETYMELNCPASCDVCDSTRKSVRKVDGEHAWSPAKKSKEGYTIQNGVGADLGIIQLIPMQGKMHAKILAAVERQRVYLNNTVGREQRYIHVREKCKNSESECTEWAVKGECQNNADYMVEFCPLACYKCADLDVRTKCPLDLNARNAWYPGDLNAMFERITTDDFVVNTYGLTILSRPSKKDAGGTSSLDTQENFYSELDKDRLPWIIQLDSFFTADEAARLVELGHDIGFKRSTEIGEDQVDYVSERRTSETAWCDKENCLTDPVVVALFQRMRNLTHIPMKNSESMQLLRYEKGGFYQIHHDYIDADRDSSKGPRILTIFLYLNDGGEPPLQGGGTNFPKLDVTVEPKIGRVVVWPSVYDYDPHKVDYSTNHQALPVEQGIKYGANCWIHIREIKAECL